MKTFPCRQVYGISTFPFTYISFLSMLEPYFLPNLKRIVIFVRIMKVRSPMKYESVGKGLQHSCISLQPPPNA